MIPCAQCVMHIKTFDSHILPNNLTREALILSPFYRWIAAMKKHNHAHDPDFKLMTTNSKWALLLPCCNTTPPLHLLVCPQISNLSSPILTPKGSILLTSQGKSSAVIKRTSTVLVPPPTSASPCVSLVEGPLFRNRPLDHLLHVYASPHTLPSTQSHHSGPFPLPTTLSVCFLGPIIFITHP